MKTLITASVLTMGSLAALSSNLVNAHGWVEFPSARQNTCYLDGGFWTDQIPNRACQNVYDMSGAHPFVQRSEIAANVPNYRDINHVQAIIPNGTLCAAGDRAKAGLDIPSPTWQRTQISPDGNNQIELVFFGKAPHNPSYWEFYLSSPHYDASKPLTWDDLELIDSAGNVMVDSEKRYRIKVTFPQERSGDAILYTRWQRIDVAGEGFYNCSDIRIAGNDSTTPDPDKNTLTSLGYFVPQGFGPVEVNDLVRLRAFDTLGTEIADINLKITENNLTNWGAQIADQFNTFADGSWFLGIWHAAMNHYMYDSENLYSNQVFAPNEKYSYAVSLIKGATAEPQPEPTDGWQVDSVYLKGDIVSYSEKSWQAKWWTQGEKPGTTGRWGVWRELP